MSATNEKPPIPASLAAVRDQGQDAITCDSDSAAEDTVNLALSTISTGLALASSGFDALALECDEETDPRLVDAALLTEAARGILAEGGSP